MKVKNLLKRIVLYGSALLFVNSVTMPFGDWLYQAQVQEIKDTKIQEACSIDDYLDELKEFDSNDAFFYLKAAHAISSKFLSSPVYLKAIQDPRGKKYEGKLYGKTERLAAFEGVADCDYFSKFTYSNFNYICDKLGKPELKEDVRYCEGRLKDVGEWWNHVWLQYKKNGKWVDYNTLWDFFSENSKIDFKSLKFTYPQGESNVTYFVDSKDGELKGCMHFGNILKGKSNLFLQIYEDLSGKNSRY